MENLPGFAAALVAGYLLGSIPTSVVVGKLFYGKDPRELGSGNAGGTNSFRVFGWKAGVVVVIVDVAKGAVAVVSGPILAGMLRTAGRPVGTEADLVALAAGAAAVAGHVWTIFAGFRGGKGVATSAGVLAAVEPVSFCITALFFGLTISSTGIVSLASLTAAVVFPVAVTLRRIFGMESRLFLIPVSWILGAFIFYTHRANIRRLLKGEEKRFEKLRLFQKLGNVFSRRR